MGLGGEIFIVWDSNKCQSTLPRCIKMTKEEFKAKRKNLGVTQANLAELLGCSRLWISSVETGRKPISRKLSLEMDALAMQDIMGTARTTVRAVSVSVAWGDISTAPTDGRVVWLWNETWEDKERGVSGVIDGFWTDHSGWVVCSVDSVSCRADAFGNAKPTHWAQKVSPSSNIHS